MIGDRKQLHKEIVPQCNHVEREIISNIERWDNCASLYHNSRQKFENSPITTQLTPALPRLKITSPPFNRILIFDSRERKRFVRQNCLPFTETHAISPRCHSLLKSSPKHRALVRFSLSLSLIKSLDHTRSRARKNCANVTRGTRPR